MGGGWPQTGVGFRLWHIRSREQGERPPYTWGPWPSPLTSDDLQFNLPGWEGGHLLLLGATVLSTTTQEAGMTITFNLQVEN